MIRSGYRFSNPSDVIRRLIASDAHYAECWERVEKSAAFAATHFDDRVERLSGWGHDFNCPKCASQMRFNLLMPYEPPNTFTCPRCGAEASGPAYDAAWVYYYRSHFGGMLADAAICALLGKEDALAFLIRYVDFYADHYAEFPVHGRHAGRGKVMEQGLDEAVWGIELIQALKVCEAILPEEKKRAWYEKLFRPMAELLIPQSNRIHNIPTWLKCAVGMIGLYFNDRELVDIAVESEFGIRNQVKKGFTADGFWRECSMTYHFYTVNALTKFFALYAEYAPEDPLFAVFERMYTSPLALSCDGHRLPAINDGWYPASVDGNLWLFFRAARVSGDRSFLETVRALLGRVREAGGERAGQSTIDVSRLQRERSRNNLPASMELLFTVVESDAVVLGATNLAVMRSPVFAILKSGVLEQSHMHPDYLSVQLPPFSDDPGTPGYAHPMVSAWYRRGPAHNMVLVDGGVPGGVFPSHVERVEDGVRAVMEEDAWPGIRRASRTLTAGNGALSDRTVFEAAEGEHVFDWIFHCDGEAAYSAEAGERLPALDGGRGYEHFTEVTRRAADGAFTAAFTLGGKTLTVAVEDAADAEIFTARAPGNPADHLRHVLILRRRGQSASFAVTYSVR